MNTFKLNEENNISNFVSINEVINYEPPKYIPNWDGSYNKIKSGKSSYFRPNKEFSKFKIEINTNNSFNLSKKSEGIYIILSEKFKFCYVGKTIDKIKQRLHSHIQKITSTNINRYTTPYKWQKLAFNRYKLLKKNSVMLDDLKIKFYHLSENLLCNIDELEFDIYQKYRNILPEYIFLNDPNKLKINKSSKNKLDETIDYIKKLDSNISLCWDQWKADLHSELQNICKSQKELDQVVDLLKKQNIGGITHEVIDKVAEYLVDENFNNPK